MADIVIRFSDNDRAAVNAFVLAIVAAKPNVRRARLDAEERLRNERAGKLAEVAFARAFRHTVNWTISDGGDGYDFRLANGSLVDIKSVAVARNLAFNFAMPIGPNEVVCDYYVQVLIEAVGYSRGIITGGISRRRFLAIAKPLTGWEHRGDVTPLVVFRSQLRGEFPPVFWGAPVA